MLNTSRALLCAIALTLFVVPVFGQGTAIEPCQATPIPAKPANVKLAAKWKLLPVDASVPSDPDVEKMLAPYSDKVRELSKVIGRLEGELTKKGVGAGSLGNFVTDGIRAQAKTKLGKPVTLAIVNAVACVRMQFRPVNFAPATSSSCCHLKTHWSRWT